MNFELECTSQDGNCLLEERSICFTADRDTAGAFFSMDIMFPCWEEDCYILLPGCAYNGNRQPRVVRSYPPMYLPEQAGVDCAPFMTDVPALEPDGSGSIQVTAGDLTVPCVGIFNRGEKRGFFVFTQQHVKGKNLGFTVKKGHITVSFPANRSDIYRLCKPHDHNGDSGIPMTAGETVRSVFQIEEFPCASILSFYERFFALRKTVMCSPRASLAYTEALWKLMEQHFNTENWSGEYYAEVSHTWQCGWVGGGMNTYPLLKYGTPLSQKRAIQTLDYLTSHQAPSGFYYGLIRQGVVEDDSFGSPGMEGVHLVRKSADALYFLFKNFTATAPKPTWVESARRCADALAMLFHRYGTFGQFVNVETGEMVVGCGNGSMIACGALAKAGAYFKEQRYLDTAAAAMEHYLHDFSESGVTNGGPGEILCAPDSESAFAMLESCVALYETVSDPKWLRWARAAAHYCASWVVTYAYEFPPESEFARLGINTTGSVFANVQNKHSAPGICTLSGDSLLKLYRWTGETDYLELLKDIAGCLPQCISTEERPIFSWDTPPQKLAPGAICERVNMSDWEGSDRVGGVFNSSCWCETSVLLTFAEVMTQPEFQ